MAEGADLDFESMLQHQLIDEEWAFGFYHWRPVVERNKCSAFAVAAEAGHPAFAGQNMDVPRYIDGGQVLFRITEPDSGRVSYVFSYAGLIGLCGMNNAPIGITCNTLNQLRPSRTGLPVAFIVRQVLSCGSVEEARAFVRFIDHASGQNFIVSGRGLSPTKVERAVQLSAEKYCSASIMMAKAAEVTHSIEMVDTTA